MIFGRLSSTLAGKDSSIKILWSGTFNEMMSFMLEKKKRVDI